MGSLLKIGDASVGLRGLDGAVTELLKTHIKEEIPARKAASLILEKVQKNNYIPDSARANYIKALERLWLERTSGTNSNDPNHKIVRILGPGCVGCNRLEQVVMEVFQESGIAADIEHVRELDEIWRYGVEKTPALVIGNKVLSSGRIPSKAQVEQWIREFML